ncbi:restriction endonuclease subunit S [Lactococcus lactis]|uniref:restriction endonuclease subunit S n=1 Tax=Lactococcus lactis TaxID=1358 RepID=UPI0024182AFD|nr:restriction endonuclease subunit S [Lactococcus lactis]MDG4965230.1 restriction endonuclease subunit S [Lactococcus lactis]
MSKNKKLVPKRRFKEFQNTDAWEQCELRNVADRFDNFRIPITAKDRTLGNIPYYGANGIQDYVEGFTHDGEFVLLAEDGANDLANYPVQYVNGKIWVNNHAHVIAGKTDVLDNKFLMNTLKKINIEPYLVGGGRAKLNSDVMMRLTLKITSIDEQIKIGEFFSNLDQTIAFQQQKLEKLQNIKKAYLNEMFI